jgi:hypothetical protein
MASAIATELDGLGIVHATGIAVLHDRFDLRRSAASAS